MPSRKPIYAHVYLKEWRKARGLSGPELGEKLNRDKFYIYRIEKGLQSVDKEERDLLGDALEVSGDDLLALPSNDVLAPGAQTQRGGGGKEAIAVRNLRPLAKRLIKKFGEPFIDAVLDEAAEPKGPPPRPRHRPKG